MNDHGEQIRIVQETVAGKEITFAHVMGGPAQMCIRDRGYQGSDALLLQKI